MDFADNCSSNISIYLNRQDPCKRHEKLDKQGLSLLATIFPNASIKELEEMHFTSIKLASDSLSEECDGISTIGENCDTNEANASKSININSDLVLEPLPDSHTVEKMSFEVNRLLKTVQRNYLIVAFIVHCMRVMNASVAGTIRSIECYRRI